MCLSECVRSLSQAILCRYDVCLSEKVSVRFQNLLYIAMMSAWTLSFPFSSCCALTCLCFSESVRFFPQTSVNRCIIARQVAGYVSYLVECIVVVSVIEELEQGDGLFKVNFIMQRERLPAFHHALLVVVYKLLDYSRMLKQRLHIWVLVHLFYDSIRISYCSL